MKYVKLGSSDLMVSQCCLGTMTWGNQNTEEEAHAQLDRAMELGVNFIDTAEMYPVPPSGETCGRTEVYIGTWLAKNKVPREKLIIASKVSGPGRLWVPGCRSDPPNRDTIKNPRLDRANILEACDSSLKRLQTSYLDLYQLHWPDRYCPGFGTWTYDGALHGSAHPSAKGEPPIGFEEQVTAVGDLIKAGKIRHWGVSNESSYGVTMLTETARRLGVPPPISIQNDFSLLERKFESELAEACATQHCNLGLLAYGALAGGTLSGKYDGGKEVPGARHTLHKGFQPRYFSPLSRTAAERYSAIARKHGLSPAVMALAWANSRFYCASVIIGATSVQQLEECIGAFEVALSEECLREVDEVHRAIPNPNRTD